MSVCRYVCVCVCAVLAFVKVFHLFNQNILILKNLDPLWYISLKMRELQRCHHLILPTAGVG